MPNPKQRAILRCCARRKSPPPPPPHDERRLAVWRALSDLFLDTEICDHTFAYIARVIRESGYTPDEVRLILWGEVYPALKLNLLSVAGVWDGWPDDWLLENIKVAHRLPRWQLPSFIRREIQRDWAKVAQHLPAPYA